MSILPISLCKLRASLKAVHEATCGELISFDIIGTVGHILPDKASQRQALGILRRAQRNCAAIDCPGTDDRLRLAWGWEEDDGLEESGGD